MQIRLICKMIGVFLMLFSISMLPPIGIAWFYHDNIGTPFMIAFAITLVTGFILWYPNHSIHKELKTRDGFVIVFLFWFVLSLFGGLPLMIAHAPHDSLTDAMFESVSGLTTTGATVLSHLEYLSHAMLYYRQQLQFLGGMGIIVLAIAIIPMLGIGGMQLYRAEVPGPNKESKLTPRLTETAKALWYIYVGLIVACTLCFWASGMPLFNAIGESYGTVSTGGFAMHDTSMAYYHNDLVEWFCIIFMLLGGMNFSLHFVALQRRRFIDYWRDIEFRAYMAVAIGASLLVFTILTIHHHYTTFNDTLLKSTFNTVSLLTTTGFVSTHIQYWPMVAQVIILLCAIMGGCAGSTSGGMKIIRIVLMGKYISREARRLLHPNAIFAIKVNKKPLKEDTVDAVWGFVAVFILLFVVFVLMLLTDGLDLTTSFGAVAACFSNTGQGIGQVVNNYANISDFAKWVLIFAMLAGRLEVFTLLVLFTPIFWRR